MTPPEELATRYGAALTEYLTGAGETALQDAYETGRWAVGQGLGLMDLAVAHRKAVITWLERTDAPVGAADVVRRATEFLEDCLAPFEMIHRGFHEANTRLETANRELAARNDELQRARKQREQLTALVVHDLKSPLSGIVLNARLLARLPSADESTRTAAENIAAATQTMQRMVMDILDISRSEEAALTLKPEPFGVQVLLERVTQELTVRASAAPQNLSYTTDPPNATIVGDAELLRRVLVNLVDNGLRHSPRGGSVEVAASEQAGQIEIRVSDNGAGVPPELRERIFDPYVQLEGGQRTRGGHGLGLAFCRIAVEAHGGTIHVEERQGGGAVFVLKLPQTAIPIQTRSAIL